MITRRKQRDNRKQVTRSNTGRVVSLGMVLALVLLGSLFIWRSAGAATATLVPNSDATSAWPTCSPTCQAAMQYSYVDEDASTPTNTDYIGTSGPVVSADDAEMIA